MFGFMLTLYFIIGTTIVFILYLIETDRVATQRLITEYPSLSTKKIKTGVNIIIILFFGLLWPIGCIMIGYEIIKKR